MLAALLSLMLVQEKPIGKVHGVGIKRILIACSGVMETRNVQKGGLDFPLGGRIT